MAKIIYISGKMKGVEDHNRPKFARAEEQLFAKDFIVINPHKLHHPDITKLWEQYLITDIEWLMKCDVIAILDDWADSKGARLEIFIAQQLGLECIYADTGKLFDYDLTLKSELRKNQT